MAEAKIHLKGWQGLVVLVVLIGVVIVRLTTFSDNKDDSALMQKLEVQLMCDYFPNEAAKLREAYDSGDSEELQNAVKSVTTAKLNIESVQTSSPLFDFSTSKDVVVKVTYSLVDASGTRDRKTKYYLFKHGSVGNSWSYQYETGVVRYYLNFT
ncbi:hypothetical protein ACFL4N_05210 [Thermodesulfobacteriota bacterium]